MLLLKKKKYAAVKVLFKDGKPYEVLKIQPLLLVIPFLDGKNNSNLSSLCRLLSVRALTWFVETGAYFQRN